MHFRVNCARSPQQNKGTNIMNRKTRLGIGVAATLALPLALGGCATERTLRIATHAPLEILDPITTTAYITRTHGYLVYDTLFAFDENGEVQPQMVDDWEVSADGRTWSFTLREGLRWQDGAPVTAEDCVASLQRWGQRDGAGQQLFRDIESLRAVDDDTFVLTLREPRGFVLETLAKISANVPFMMPARVAATDAYTPVADTLGSGPYIFRKEGWTPGANAVYEKNQRYVARSDPPSLAAGSKQPMSDRIELISFATQEEAVQALKDGTVHYMESPSVRMVASLQEDPGIVVTTTDPLGNIAMLRFNAQQPPFDDPAIRRAVVMSLQQRDFMSAALEDPGYWRACYSVFPCGTVLENDAASAMLKIADPELGRQLVRTARYDGTPVVLLNPVDVEVISAFALVAADTMREIGLNVVVEDMSWAELLERRNSRGPASDGGWSAFTTWWLAGDLLDPTSIAFSGDPASGWIGWPADAELEALRTAYVQAPTLAERRVIATQVQERVLQIGAFGILGQFFEPVAFRTSVRGITTPIQFYWGMYVED